MQTKYVPERSRDHADLGYLRGLDSKGKQTNNSLTYSQTNRHSTLPGWTNKRRQQVFRLTKERCKQF